MELCLASNEPAPTTLRVNPLKTTRDQLLSLFPYSKPTSASSFGVQVAKKENFFAMTAFKEGLFEVQDEGSQLISELLDIKPGHHVVDYCAGSGGKSLAFAYKTEGKGQIYLHDIRKHALQEAKKRLKRAGVQNFQLKLPKHPVDRILVDAPCSGSGTLRRNPDMKWKFTPEMLTRITQEQRVIFEEALRFLKPDGLIVYATCSILKAENESQVAHFKETFNLEEVTRFQSFPQQGGMDGFFACALKRS